MFDLLQVLDFYDILTKLGSLLLVLISIFTVVHFLGRSYRAVYLFFRLYGLTRTLALRISFFCRKDWVNHMRLFMEYAIFATRGVRQSKAVWGQIISTFYSKYVQSMYRTADIVLESTFVLHDENIKKTIEEYFKYISKGRFHKYFVLDTSTYSAFVGNIMINSGYLLPLVQISSLQERYGADWSKILEKYVGTFRNPNKQQQPSEVFSFYTWLMWGPSVQLRCNAADYKLCLYGLGDESMAATVVLPDSDSANSLWELIQQKENEFGASLSGKFKLCHTNSYISHKYNKFGESAVHFVENIAADETKPFVLELLDYTINRHMEESDSMFSAYIWVMLYYTEEGNEHLGFNCENSSVWFEHANVADQEDVELLTDTLIHKCVKYLETIWSDPRFDKRVYQVPWAINEPFRRRLESEIKKLKEDEQYPYHKQLSERFLIEDTCIPQDEILSNIDDVFAEDELSVVYLNIDFNNPAHMGLFGRFYCELYMSEFPDENERETLNNMISQARRLAPSAEASYRCIIATKGNKIVGGAIGDYFAQSNSGVIEFIVTASEERGKHVGTGLINSLIGFWNKDAKRMRGVNSIDYYFFEVENPALIVDPMAREGCVKRLYFWQKLAARILDISYVQPPLEPGKEAVNYLFLAIRIINSDLPETKISSELLLTFVADFYRYAFGIADARSCEQYIKLEKELHQSDVTIKKITPEKY